RQYARGWISWVGLLRFSALIRGLAVAAAAVAAAAAREIGEELVDQVLEHDRGLGLQNLAAVLEIRAEAARADPDVLSAEQPLGLDAGVAIFRNLAELRINVQVHVRPEAVLVQADRGHVSDSHASHPNGRADLEVPDVVEFGRDVVARDLADAELEPAGGQLGGEKNERGEAQNHE